MDIGTLLITLEVTIGILIALLIPTWKFVFFWWKMMFLSRKWKGNVGLIFSRSLGGNFGIPRIVKIDSTMQKRDEKIYGYQREMFTQGTFFGKPFAMFDAEDMKTSLGLYKQQCDADGNPLYHVIPTGMKNDKDQPLDIHTKIPVLHATKTSVTLSPGLLHAGVVAVALGEAIKEFLNKHKMLLIVCGIAALLAGAAAFFGYTNQNTISELCAVQFNSLKESTMQCIQQAAQNISVEGPKQLGQVMPK